MFLPTRAFPTPATEGTHAGSRLELHSGWILQSSCKVTQTGEVISTEAFHPNPDEWYKATVPSTVLAAQVEAGVFPDPYFGMNLRNIPGASYPIGAMFSQLPMPKESPYACSWWYSTSFTLPEHFAHEISWLHFDGINYRANIWLNGRKLADSSDVAGAYRRYQFNLAGFVQPGRNALAVEVFAPTESDLAINWVDWNPTPPDKNMGLWGDVYLDSSGPVSVRHPAVATHFTDDTRKHAELTIIAGVRNGSGDPVEGVLEARIAQSRVFQKVSLKPGEERTVTFSPDRYFQLKVADPRLWWPAGMGEQTMQEASLRFLIDGRTVSDEQTFRFGIREVTSEFTEQGHRLFLINGRKLLIRGAGWSPDMLLRHSHDRLEAQFQYVMGMRLNTLRLEGKLESDEFFDLADRYGILVMAGWCCCDIWEQWDKWKPETLAIATASLRSQIVRLRGHPSLLAWLNGSDSPPPAWVERAYNKVLKEEDWPTPILSSASDTPTEVSGESGVKMTGPYDYVPPNYWLADRNKFGGAYGFNTETSPGPAVPVVASMRKMLPPDHLWPPNGIKNDDFWKYHAGGERFQTLDVYNQAMEATYGAPTSLEDYSLKSQMMAYDGERAMFEAYSRNRYRSTGVIQWMLNNAWPSIIWHLYDYYAQPGGGYFGVRKANEPLHVQFSYDDNSVAVVNNTYEAARGVTVSAQLYDFDLKELFSKKQKLDLEPDNTIRPFKLPKLPAKNPAVYFLRLGLQGAAGGALSSNFYWLPARPATLAWDKTTDTTYTPIASQADLKMLNHLTKVKLQIKAAVSHSSAGDAVRVSLLNPTKALAFQVHLAIQSGPRGEEILPVLWDDNYVELMPGESRVISAQFPGRASLGEHASLQVDGWKVESENIPLR